MQLQPIIYTTDMERAVAWYSRVLDAHPGYSSDVWTSIPVGGATLGIHLVDDRPDGSNVALSLVTDEALDSLAERLAGAGIEIERPIQDEPFGRSLVVRDPDGSPIQINEHHR